MILPYTNPAPAGKAEVTNPPTQAQPVEYKVIRPENNGKWNGTFCRAGKKSGRWHPPPFPGSIGKENLTAALCAQYLFVELGKPDGFRARPSTRIRHREPINEGPAMKVVLIILLLIVGVVAYLLLAPSSGSSTPSTPETPTVAQPGGNANVPVAQGGSQPASADQPKQRMPLGTGTLVDDAGAVAAYGMGHTQVMIKNRTATKIDEINKKQNEQLNKELEQ
ncbi:MAG: hypothetical protein RBU25_08730 [Lentisphaeria bacterium]|nr:hypothetical protein [Lentisphaeria bacterium]